MSPKCVSSLGAAAALVVALLSPAVAQNIPQQDVPRQDIPRLDVPFVPTPPQVVERMLKLAGVTKDDFVIDLGSGDGRIPVAAARIYGARALGVDIDPRRIAEARENARKAGVSDKVSFAQQNLFDAKISDASVITMYLLWNINLELRPRLLTELKPGTRIVSHSFDLGEWEADTRDTVENRSIYMWTVPEQVSGRWQLQAGERLMSLELKQQFQQVNGAATIDGRTAPLRSIHLNGRMIEFVVDIDGTPTIFSGEVNGDTIDARPPRRVDGAKPAGHWRASRAS